MPRLLSRIRPFFVITASVTTEICTLSLHDALPICHPPAGGGPHGAERRAQLQRVSRRRADAHGATRVDGADALPESRWHAPPFGRGHTGHPSPSHRASCARFCPGIHAAAGAGAHLGTDG